MEAWEARSGGGKGSLKLFGVTICGGDAAAEAGAGVGEEVLRKSKSTGNLASAERAAESEAADRGYLSDGGVRKPGKRRRRRAGVGGHERKKGIPWTEEEHRTFLEGLEKLGKGDWRGISRKFVITRTPTQVASHAQKYFIRQSIPSNRRRRSSLFDVVINDTACIPETVPAVSFNGAQNGSDESNFLSQDKKRVGTLELNSVWVSSLGQERHAGLHLMVDRGGVSRPNSCSCVGRAPGLVKIEPASAGPEKSQTLTLMHDAPQSTDSGPFKLQTHQPAPSQGYVQLLLCRPSQANTARQVTKGNDLDLSIAPPGPLCF